MNQRQNGSTSYPINFLMVDSGDHVTGKTGLTPTVTISKNGGSFASPSGAVTELANGWYSLAGNATDRDTNGELLLHATGSGADPVDEKYIIVPWNPFDAVRLGLTALPNAAPDAAGGLPISDAGGLDMDAILSRIGVPSVTLAEDIAGVITHGDSAWITATGFSTHSASDVWAVSTRRLSDGTNIVLPSNALANIVIDGLTFESWATAILAVTNGTTDIADAEHAVFNDQSGNPKVTIVYGTNPGERDSVVIA